MGLDKKRNLQRLHPQMVEVLEVEIMNHKQIYKKHFDIAEDEITLCEVCGRHTVNIHHILFKSQGGTDEIENLIALCTGDNKSCHDISHGKIPGRELTRETLFSITGLR
jgi:hypothetical protein